MALSRSEKSSRRKKKKVRWFTGGAVALLAIAAGFIIWLNAPDNQTLNPQGADSSQGEAQGNGGKGGKDQVSPSSSPSPSATPFVSVSPTPAGTNANGSAGGNSPEKSASPSAKPSGNAAVPPSGSSSQSPTSSFPNDPNRVKLTFVGDVIFGSTVETVLKQNGWDYPYLGLKEELGNADITFANLETPITERGTAQDKEYAYRSSPLALPAFQAAGFDIVNLANNHILDYGQQGLLDTFTNLDKMKIRYIGAGKNSEEAFRPVIMERKGMKIAYLGFSKNVPDTSWKAGKDHPGVADTYNYTVPVAAIKKAREQADLVVVIAHWGTERKMSPEDYQKDLAHRYIDAGADLVVGGHPHVLQGFEEYKGKWIAYSMGNFLFTTRSSDPETLDTMILHASCSRERQCDLQAVPVFTQWAKPERMSPEAGEKLFERLTQISIKAAVEPDGRVINKAASTQ